MKTVMTKLGDVATYIRGINFKPDDVVPIGTVGSVACMRTKNVQSELDTEDVWAVSDQFVRRAEQYLQEGDLLVSSANSWNLVGKCSWIPALPLRATFGGFVSVVRPDATKISARYLYRWFSSDRIQATLRSFGQQTTNISNLNADRTLKMEIPLPPLPEQRRIADILDRAEALRSKSRAALALLDTLTQSIFLDMFGDPVTNPKGWPIAPMGSLFSVKHGFAFKSEHFFDTGDYVLLTPGNFFESGGYRDRGEKQKYYVGPIPDGYILGVNDILVAMTEQAPGLLGSPILIPESDRYLHNQRLGLLEVKSGVEKLFLFHLFNTSYVRNQIQASSSGTKVKHTSPGKIMEVIIPIPPLPLQQEFSRRVEAVERMRASQRSALAKLDELFAGLQHRAFRGEL